MLIGVNRIHDDPYNLQLCNAERSADTVRRLERFIPPLFEVKKLPSLDYGTTFGDVYMHLLFITTLSILILCVIIRHQKIFT